MGAVCSSHTSMEGSDSDWDGLDLISSDNCTELGLTCLQADLQNVFLNPHLFPLTQAQYWLDGVLLLLVFCVGAVLNTYLIFRLPCSSATTDDSILRLQAGADMLLLYVLLLRRIPPIFLDTVFLSTIFPNILLYTPALETGLTTLASLLFLVMVGSRHLRQVETKSYNCLQTVVFMMATAMMVTVPAIFEVELVDMSRDTIEQNTAELNITMELSEENLVILHTDLYYHKTYKDLFRMLFNFLTSQVAVIWILPIIFLHSKNVYKLNKKRRIKNDILTPIISLFFILFSLPQLAVFLTNILLFHPPDLMVRVAGLCLACIASFKPLLYLCLDQNIRRDLSLPCCYRDRTLIPREDF